MPSRADLEDDPDPQRRDDDALNRELGELTSELRMLIAAATVLFAFLLTVPFASGFPALGSLQRIAFFIAFLSTAMAVVFFLAEAAYHQIRGKPYDKGLLIKTATRQMIAGLILLAIALCSVIFLVTDLMFGPTASIAVTTVVLGQLCVAWFLLPAHRRRRGSEQDAPQKAV